MIPMPQRSPVKAFTLVELLAMIAIGAVLATAALFYTVSYVQYAKDTANKQTLVVLNDALTRYKCGGGNMNQLTLGAPIGHVITALQTAVTWAGLKQQFLNTGQTYPSSALQALGSGAQYQFYSYNGYTPQAPAFGTPTNLYPYGSGVGYMANGSAQAYTNVNITASSGFYAVKLSSGATTVYTSGINHSFGTADSITFRACAGPAGADNGTNSVASGNITVLVCNTNQLTSLDLSGFGSSLTSITPQANPYTSVNLHGCSGLTGTLWWNSPTGWTTAQLTSLNVAGCSNITALYCNGNNLTSLDLTGCTSLATLQCYGNQITSLDVSGHRALTTFNFGGGTPLLPLTSLNLSGCTGLTGSLFINYPGNVSAQLTSLNVSGCTGITYLACTGNSLPSLNASGCTNLSTLSCINNQLGNINITGDTALPASSTNNSTTFRVQNNPSVTITGP